MLINIPGSVALIQVNRFPRIQCPFRFLSIKGTHTVDTRKADGGRALSTSSTTDVDLSTFLLFNYEHIFYHMAKLSLRRTGHLLKTMLRPVSKLNQASLVK